MAAPACVRSPWSAFKRVKIQASPVILYQCLKFTTSSARSKEEEDPIIYGSDPSALRTDLQILRPQDGIRNRLIDLAVARDVPLPTQLQSPSASLRLPRNVQTLYLEPLRRTPTYGIPVANLQLRSFSVRNLEFVADLAVRAAYYLNLPAKGPIPLPRITQRWTVPRSSFIFKKSQENFERVTLRRLVQVLDGDPEVVQRWLSFVRKWSWYGVGLKADVFEFEGLEVGKRMDDVGDAVASGLENVKWEFFGRRKGLNDEDAVREKLRNHGFDALKSSAVPS